MRQLDLSEFHIGEKFSWLEDAHGAHQAVSCVVGKLDEPGVALEKLCLEVKEEDEIIGDDMVAWFVDGCAAYDAVLLLSDFGYDVDFAVNAAVMEAGLDIVDEYQCL